MTVELASVTQRPNFELTPLQFDMPIADYALSLENLGIVQRIYVSDFVKGKKDNTFGVFVWCVLTPYIASEGMPTSAAKKIQTYARSLRDEVTSFGLPVEIHTVFVKPKREQALKAHLDRNNINYTY